MLKPIKPLPDRADMASPRPASLQPRWLRLTHWLNAGAFVVMAASGWRIYNASPFLGFRIPRGITLGGWLGGALLWHFAAMWLLVANALAYLVVSLASGHLRRRFLPVRWRALAADLAAAVHGRLQHAEPGRYNQIQRVAYLFAMLDLAALVVSGLVLWKSVQFPLLRELLGGYEPARRIHFAAMAAGCAFLVGHAAMALLYPRTLWSMLRGR